MELTLPWERPSTDSPNCRWLTECWHKYSFICFTSSAVSCTIYQIKSCFYGFHICYTVNIKYTHQEIIFFNMLLCYLCQINAFSIWVHGKHSWFIFNTPCWWQVANLMKISNTHWRCEARTFFVGLGEFCEDLSFSGGLQIVRSNVDSSSRSFAFSVS